MEYKVRLLLGYFVLLKLELVIKCPETTHICCSMRIELTKTITTLYSFIFDYQKTSGTNWTFDLKLLSNTL